MPLYKKFYHQTPIGWVAITSSEDGLHELKFIHPPKQNEQKKTALVKEVIETLDRYFINSNRFFNLPLHFTGTPFQKIIWKLVASIPFGETRTYSEIASLYGNPQSVRAVGAAIGSNPILILVPCHRVLGRMGALTGYAGGLERKKWLLEHEGYPIQKALNL